MHEFEGIQNSLKFSPVIPGVTAPLITTGRGVSLSTCSAGTSPARTAGCVWRASAGTRVPAPTTTAGRSVG